MEGGENSQREGDEGRRKRGVGRGGGSEHN